MEKITEMNREIFRNNLIITIGELRTHYNLKQNESKFKIIAVAEPEKPLNAVDDSMRLWALSEENIGSRLLSLDDTVRLLSCNSPLVPIWINVSILESTEKETSFKLETSLRFRKPSFLRNVETGHAPFKAIIS